MTAVLVLALDTSTPQITVGLVEVAQPHEVIAALQAAGNDATAVDADRLLAERTVTDAFGHVEKLMPLIAATLSDAQLTLSQLHAAVVGIGPGPYTGLRVGMATATALGDALAIPVHGVPSHDAFASAAGPDEGLLVVTDARRREVYVSGYGPSGARAIGPIVIAPADLPAALDGFTVRALAGPGAPLLAGMLDTPVRTGEGSIARGLVQRAHRALVTGAVPGPLTPLYLRRPDAAEPHAPKSALPHS